MIINSVIKEIFQNLFKKYSKVFIFHLRFMLIPVKKIAGNIRGKKTVLKKGAPTDMSCWVKTSITKGHKVPIRIVRADAHKNILFSNKPPSLENKKKYLLFSICSYFMANKSNELAVTMNKKLRI